MKYALGLKVLLIGVISFALFSSLVVVESKVYERERYRAAAKSSIERGWSGSQIFAGPVIYAFFSQMEDRRVFDENLKKYVVVKKRRHWKKIIIPEQMTISGNVVLQERYKGIYKIPVYDSDLALQGEFAPMGVFQTPPDSIALIVSMTDRRGLSGPQIISLNGVDSKFKPGSGSKMLGAYLRLDLSPEDLTKGLKFKMSTRLKGMDELAFVPNAKQLIVEMSSAWQHPYFSGEYLPEQRQIGEGGFTARWQLSELSTSIHDSINICVGSDAHCAQELMQTAFGTGFYSPIDIYQKTDRALKYGFLFIVLTFVVFFIYEYLKRLAIHPVQYTLVGAALALFYLLLISLSEHFGFNKAYLIATLSCVALIAGYLASVFKSKTHALFVSAGLTLLYTMLYYILKSEDYALLMGTSLVFTVLAIAMYGTRNVDWYALKQGRAVAVEQEDQNDPQIR